MKFTEFCIRHPVTATITNLLILIVGLLSYDFLTVREYPDVVSPILTIEVLYPNASPAVVETQITNTLEDVLAGIEGVETVSSTSMYGRSRVEMHFKPYIDMSDAQSNIRDRLGMVRQILPDDAKDPSVFQQRQDDDSFLYFSVTGEGYSQAELSHLAKLHVVDPLKTIKGVSQVEIFGVDYTMMIELDRNKMMMVDIDAQKVFEKLEKYHVSLPAGRYQGRVPINLDMKLQTPEDFKALPIANHGGKVITLGDIANIGLGTTTSFVSRVDGKRGVLLGIKRSSDGNPLEISKIVHRNIEAYQRLLPHGVNFDIIFDKTRFIKGSLDAVTKAILEAVVLVMLIVFLFLKSFRSTMIPIVTIPISLIGVMSLMALFGLSVNTITLLAMVLAVGLVVDDAIVVLENIHRHVEGGLPPLKAAIKGAKEIGFAIIAMTCTLAAAYAPIAFMQDTIGQVFFEFAVTLAGAVIISGIVALTFSPLMCSRLLKAEEKHVSWLGWFDRGLEKMTSTYNRFFAWTLKQQKKILASCMIIFLACGYLYTSLPKMITPKEDRGVVGVFMPYLAGANLSEFDAYVKKAETLFKAIPESPSILSFTAGWGAQIVTGLVNWSDRSRSAEDIVNVLRKQVQDIPTVEIYPWSWDSGIPGVEAVSSSEGGIQFVLKTTGSYEYLSQYADKLKKALDESGVLSDVRHDLKLNFPSYDVKVDRAKLELTGLEPEKIAKTIAIMMDQDLGIDFEKDGLRYAIALVNRVEPKDLEELYVLNDDDIRIPVSSFMTLERTAIAKELNHHNKMRSAMVSGNAMPGVDMGKAVSVIQSIAQEILPNDIHPEFSGGAQKLQDSSTMMLLLIFVAMVFIYCILAIQFESFIDPMIIMFTVPLAGFGALVLVKLTGGSMNIFAQVGLVTLIGLITKHGILIVEFANQRVAANLPVIQAIQQAAEIRFRPIVMTTAATIFGTLPLILSSGAGAEARQAIGIVLLGGLILGTILTLFIIPTVYLWVKSRGKKSTEN